MTKLEEIFQFKLGEIEAAKSRVPLSQIEAMALSAPPIQGFRLALENAPVPVALIAEVKKASPSEGLIRPNFDPFTVAQTYRWAGAHCLSVLTDEHYFQGSPENIRIAREASGLPCLRKDFICDPYQVYEARAWEADAILLIVASLPKPLLIELHKLATRLGMDVLVEVHDGPETEVALSIGSRLIGVNNRNLHTFKTDLATSDELLPLISPHAIAVSESAINSLDDVDRVHAAGARAVLVGTAFCRNPDIGAKVQEVMGW